MLGAIAGAAIIVVASDASAQPAGVVPDLHPFSEIAAGTSAPVPATAPASWDLRLSVSIGSGTSLEALERGVVGVPEIEAYGTDRTRLKLRAPTGELLVVVTARLPFGVGGVAGLLGAPASATATEEITRGTGGYRKRIWVSTSSGTLIFIVGEGSGPINTDVLGLEASQSPAREAFPEPSSGWNHATPVTVRIGGSETELWQGQAVTLVGGGTERTVVAVASSTVALPQGEGRHLLEGEPYLLAVLVLHVP